ncbi:GNAT family N-acetyltransferase [Isoptericola sp. b441]|uniref:GNAT family N-acetyltransferase n=1 Tax=Actinotalea lenta TaxID=3064654 RepID=A0ABT9D637_9CELL|nr:MULTISPECIES: GNAT family N-acetyltransferase [unclassified Isoptericola]MDO8106282.1 GNAT family N-acetyltransferase [Isoptericola sp. b441]MDO8121998.1 GNAT family N-acetyltransferase [Isoptericola sp. b490]
MLDHAAATTTVLTAPTPTALDDPDAWALHGAAAVSRAVKLEHWGDADTAVTAQALLARQREQRYATRVCLVATDPGREGDADNVLGKALLTLPSQGNDHAAVLDVSVHPAARRRGVGSALLARGEALAAEAGRTTLVAASEHAGEPDPGDPLALVAPTGSGRIRSDAAAAVVARRRGYALAQAERYSTLDLPVDRDLLEALRRDAAARAGGAYRLVSWADAAPARWLDAFAELETRMTTDAPVGEVDAREEVWDAARVRARERQLAAAGFGYRAVAVQHVPDGALVGLTMVEYPRDRPEVVEQNDTIVLRAHRGRRLGMLLKATMLADLAVERPAARRVHTWNAEENAPMLAINVALGFRPRGVVGLWQTSL